MSFADELRQAPDMKKKEEEKKLQLQIEQQKDDLKRLANEWDKYIRNTCKHVASAGRTSCSFEFHRFIEDMKDTFESNRIMQDWWTRISPRIYCKLHPRSEFDQICLSKEDVEVLEATIKRYLEMDDLSVTIKRKEHQTYRIEYVFVERSKGARAAASIFNTLLPLNELGLREDEGDYKPRKVPDEVRYDLTVSVSW